jgi:hypothetical protein
LPSSLIRSDTARVKVRNAECVHFTVVPFFVDAEYKGWFIRIPSDAFAQVERGMFENIDSLGRRVLMPKNGRLVTAVLSQPCDSYSLSIVGGDSISAAIAVARPTYAPNPNLKDLSAATPLVLPSDTPQVKVDYDRLQDYTSITAPDIQLSEKVKIESYFICHGKTSKCHPSQVTMLFSRSGEDWEFLRYHPMVMLLNGTTRFRLGESDYDGTVGNGYVMEFQTVKLTLSQFLQLAAAKSVEGSWGLYHFELNTEQRASIRALANAIRKQ